MSLFDSLLAITEDVVTIVSAPLEVGAKIAEVVVHPLAQATEAVVEEVKNILE